MSFLLTSISNQIRTHFYYQPTSHAKKFSIARKQIPTLVSQQRYLHPWTVKVLETWTGRKMLTKKETSEAIVKHQKLWVAHFSIHNHEECHAHYEEFYSLQLFKQPKDFSVQSYYTSLINKDKCALSITDLQELISLYQFALNEQGNVLHWFSIVYAPNRLQEKLEGYRTLLNEKSKPTE